MPKKLLHIAGALLAVTFWIAVWWVLAIYIGKPLLLPAPPAVLSRLAELAITADFWKTALLSLYRILSGILWSILFGVLAGILTAKLPPLRILLRPLLTVVRATPVASFIILLLIWVDRDAVPVIISVLIALPVIWKNVEAAVLAIPKELIEMTKAFHLPLCKRLLSLDLPSILPAFHAATETSIGLAWKAGIAAEVLAVPAVSIGRMIFDSKLYLETTDLFAWTLTVILLSLLIEIGFSFLLGKVFPQPKHPKGKEDSK